jgi:hypothetical protein
VVHTQWVELDSRLLDVCLHLVSGIHSTLQRAHHGDGRHDLVLLLVPQHLQHGDVVYLASRLLQYAPIVADDDGVCGDDEGRLAALCVVDLADVDVFGLLRGGLENVVEGAQVVGQVFGELGGADFDVGQAQLCAISRGTGS